MFSILDDATDSVRSSSPLSVNTELDPATGDGVSEFAGADGAEGDVPVLHVDSEIQRCCREIGRCCREMNSQYVRDFLVLSEVSTDTTPDDDPRHRAAASNISSNRLPRPAVESAARAVSVEQWATMITVSLRGTSMTWTSMSILSVTDSLEHAQARAVGGPPDTTAHAGPVGKAAITQTETSPLRLTAHARQQPASRTP